jgi:preprotein translocase subunit SecY
MLKNIINTLVNSFKVPELKSRIIFTLLVLLVCRLVAMIPIPGLDGAALSEYMSKSQNQGGLIGMYSMFTGGALEKCAIGSLGIMPYISATIIIQLLTAVIPQLSKLAREEGGRTKIIQYGRYLTVLLCLGQGLFMTLGWENAQKVLPNFQGTLVLYENLWWYRIQTTLILTTGVLLLMWLGEQITERGIGNGVSLVITIGILARLPVAMRDLSLLFTSVNDEPAKFNVFHGIALIIMLFVIVAGIISVTQAQRKIPVQYAQRAVGRKVYSGQSSFMPLRVNYAGVMPVIFAQAILMFPGTILTTIGQKWDVKAALELARFFDPLSFSYMVIFGLMILFFSYFWVATQFNEIQISDDLKKNGGYIPGVRPGAKTTEFLHNTMSRITLAGAVFLTIIAVIPLLMNKQMNMPHDVAAFFGGTGMLILVGVMLDTMRQVESHLLMRHYDGFLKKGGRIRGRM